MNNSHHVNVGGLSQPDRKKPALKPNFVSIDHQSSLAIMEACRPLANSVGFHNFFPEEFRQQRALVSYIDHIQLLADELALLRKDGRQEVGRFSVLPAQFKKELERWFPSDQALTRVPPHMQLFLCFLQLLKHPQRQFDELTARHTNFYYQDVLKFQNKSAVPDSVYLTFELEDEVERCLLKQGCLLSAPGLKDHPNVQYALDRSLTVNQAKITQIRQVAAKSSIVQIQFDAAQDQTLTPFYLLPQDPAEESETTSYSMSTLYLISSLLNLQEGQRTITMSYTQEGESLANLATIEISTATGWQELNSQQYNVTDQELVITLDEFFPPVTPIAIAGEADPQPALKLIPKAGSRLLLTQLALSVKVKGLKDLILNNGEGTFPNNTTFDLFGFEPSEGAVFGFANPEICSKPLTSLTLNTEWVPGAVPNNENGSPDINKIYYYYPDPNDGSQIIGQTPFGANGTEGDYIVTFTVGLNLCAANGQSLTLTSGKALFSPLQFDIDLTVNGESFTAGEPAIDYYQLKLIQGDFLYQQYLIAQNQQAQYQTELNLLLADGQDKTTDSEDLETLQSKIGTVYPPYTPALRPLSVDYQTEPQNQTLRYVNEIGDLEPCTTTSASPSSEAALLLNLAPVQAKEIITLLLKMESYWSAEKDKDQPQLDNNELSIPSLNWFYFADNQWQPLEMERSETNPLHDAWILSFRVPPEVDSDSLWLKMTIREGKNWPATQLVYLQTQAARATYALAQGDDERNLNHPLPPHRINSFVVEQPKIRAVDQPFASFGGHAPQTNHELAVSASERVGHRQRAITAGDYEKMVLAQFPQIKQVWCLTATQLAQINQLDPSATNNAVNIQILVNQQVHRTKQSVYYPLADHLLIEQVKTYLEKYSSPFVKVWVSNPHYRTVAVTIQAKFNDNKTGHAAPKLNRDLTRLLAQQLLDEDQIPILGRRLDLNQLRREVAGQEYIQKIQQLSIPNENADQIGMTLVPALSHPINREKEENHE